jgi:hypothetical protein
MTSTTAKQSSTRIERRESLYFAAAFPPPYPSAPVTSFAFCIMKPASLLMAMN